MITPQQIDQISFSQSRHGYDMEQVDKILEPLTEDYITLYKENAVLKSKMKVLVEKLEEYRSQEESMRKAIISAQRTADAMVAEAEKKAAQLMNNAQAAAETKTVDTSAVTAQADAVVRQETERMNNAKRTAENAKYLDFTRNFRTNFSQFFVRLKNMKKYKYFRCPECKARLRLPRKVGEVTVTCGKCHHQFKQKA